MVFWNVGLRNIVDVDGQLLAIDADFIEPTALLAKANRPIDCQLWLVRAGERFQLQARELVRLSQDEVLFFETEEVRQQWIPKRLAA